MNKLWETYSVMPTVCKWNNGKNGPKMASVDIIVNEDFHRLKRLEIFDLFMTEVLYE